MKLLTVSILMMMGLLLSCQPKDNKNTDAITDKMETTIWVNGFKIACPLHQARLVLPISEKDDAFAPAPWLEKVDSIQGFTFELGLFQQIQVIKKQQEMVNPKDSCVSQFQYEYLNTLKTVKDQRIQLHDIWGLKTVHGEMLDQGAVTMEINLTQMMMFLSGLCVQTSMPIETLGQVELKVGPRKVMGEDASCLDQDARNLLDALRAVRSYKREKNQLMLLDSESDIVLGFIKMD